MSRLSLALAGLAGLVTLCGIAGAAEIPSRPGLLPKGGVGPREFGTQDERILVIHASSFAVSYCNNGMSVFAAYLGRTTNCPNNDTHYYATLDIPAGAMIDAVGLNTASDTNFVFGLALWLRNADGTKTLLTSLSAPSHDWNTDFVGPLFIQVPDHLNHELVLDVENAANPNSQYFGWVEVHWRRTVSPAPATATFADVPTSNPFFQYIEAIHAAGITAGCGGGNFCPDQPITRKQEAAFIAKALGLHWPN
jgi:hypothetical protein